MVLKQKTISKVEEIFSKTGYNFKILWETGRIQGTNTLVEILCNICNCSETFFISNLYKGKYSCVNCREKKLKERAELLNFKYIKQIKIKNKKLRVLLECKVDNSVTTSETHNFLNKKVRCETCVIVTYKNALAIKNCTYVSHNTIDSITRVTFKNEYGEERTVDAQSLLANKWALSDNLSSWVQKSYVYCFWFYTKGDIFLAEGYYYKIGVSNDPTRRLKDIKISYNVSIKILSSFNDRFLAIREEKRLHDIHLNYKLPFETAKLFTSGESLGKSINGERKRRKDGITEWFYNIDKGIHAELFTTN